MKKPLSKFIAAVTAASCSTVVFANSAMEEMIVSSSRIEIPLRQIGTSVSVIDGAEIQLRGYNSLVDVLRTQPGISVSNTGGSGKATSLRIRGEEGFRTLMMIDGVDVSDPSGLQVGPKIEHFLSGNDIEKIEVLRGSQGFIYGADAGGVINIFTKTGEGELGGNIDAEVGRYGSQKLSASLSAGNDLGDFYVSATDLESDGFNSRSDDTVLRDEDGYENTTFHTKLGWNATEDLRVQLVLRDIDASAEFDNCFSSNSTNVCDDDYEQTTGKLSLDYDMGDFSHYLSYAETDITRANFADGQFSFGAEGETKKVEYMGSYRINDSAVIVFGADLEEEELLSNNTGETTDRKQVGYYAEYSGQFTSNWYYTAGLRHDDNDDFGNHTSGRVSTAYIQDFDDGASIKYRASYGTGFRAPSLTEIDINANASYVSRPSTAEDLTEETSKGFDIGIEYFNDSGLHLTAVYFDQKVEDAIEYDLVGTLGYTQLGGISTSDGVELTIDYPLNESFTLLANVTFNETEKPNGDTRARRPETVSNLGFKYSGLDSKLNVIVNYRGSRDAVETDGSPLDNYEILDISASYNITSALEVYGRVENALNEDYVEVRDTGFNVSDFNTSGSATYAGVRYSF
jgi:vitamin B12 transporter